MIGTPSSLNNCWNVRTGGETIQCQKNRNILSQEPKRASFLQAKNHKLNIFQTLNFRLKMKKKKRHCTNLVQRRQHHIQCRPNQRHKPSKKKCKCIPVKVRFLWLEMMALRPWQRHGTPAHFWSLVRPLQNTSETLGIIGDFIIGDIHSSSSSKLWHLKVLSESTLTVGNSLSATLVFTAFDLYIYTGACTLTLVFVVFILLYRNGWSYIHMSQWVWSQNWNPAFITVYLITFQTRDGEF